VTDKCTRVFRITTVIEVTKYYNYKVTIRMLYLTFTGPCVIIIF